MPASAPFLLPPTFPPTDTLYYPARLPAEESAILVFLPGNPGLIGYYEPFLSTLSSLCPTLSILGASHAGFTPSPLERRGSGRKHYGLESQVECKLRLLAHVAAWKDREDREDREGVAGERGQGGERAEGRERGRRKVVLVAHSMGCWLAMEVLRLLHETREEYGDEVGRPDKGDGRAAVEEVEDATTLAGRILRGADVVAGIMLFPTVVDIAKSRSGRILGPILTSPLARTTLTRLTTLLAHLPTGLVQRLVRAVTGHPAFAAAATTTMLQRPEIVAQALELAAEEMVSITADRWDRDIWAAEGRRMVFYFGKEDHWVAEETREEIIKLRAGEHAQGLPEMLVCEEGLPHGFCIDHGERMAEKVTVWIEAILNPQQTHI